MAMREAYFDWLVDLLDDEYLEKNYQKLLHKLFNTEFTWTIDYDANRATDGLSLRDIYAQEVDKNFIMRDPCSLLEMMIALAKKCEDDLTYDPDLGDRTGYWFWVMIENMDLDIYDDFYYDESKVSDILGVTFAGNVPLFKNLCHFYDTKLTHKFDKKDLWWQLNTYLNDHFLA